MSGTVQRILTFAGRGCVAALALALVLHGSTKRPPVRRSAAPTSTPAPVAVRTAPSVAPVPGIPDPPEAPPGMCAATNWWRRGAFSDWRRVDFPGGWSFPWGTNRLRSAALLACGEVRPLGDPTPVASVGVPLGLVPLEGVLWYGPTPSNTYAFAWRRALAGRDRARPVDARIELFRNGDVAVSTNGVARRIPRELPFPHDGYGQDADWVRANFADAEAILRVGYANWVDAQVGTGLTNGLYRFEAVFPEDPPEATRLVVGDLSACVTNAGAYAFVLEKGREYRFRTEPHDGTVRYAVRDDMGDAVPAAHSAAAASAPGVWTVGGGERLLALPLPESPGRCLWMPTLRGSPDLAHLGPGPFPAAFEAVLSDYCGGGTPSFSWWASDSAVRFTTPNARTTRVEGGPLPGWGSLAMSVRADLPGGPLVSRINLDRGTVGVPQAQFSMRTPEVIFLNDDGRTTRWYRVSMSLASPVETNATVAIGHTGATGVRFATDPIGAHLFSPTNVRLHVSSSGGTDGYHFYYACERIGVGSFLADCTLEGGEIQSTAGVYRVVEPLRKLVSTERAPGGGYYNPSRLVAGARSWLKVGVRGDYEPSDVVWRIVSGPGMIAAMDGWAAAVEPTASSGEVVVEAAFGSDSPVQPRFVLPIVTRRTIPVRAFVLASGDLWAASPISISNKFELANRIFSQVGITFNLLSVTVADVGMPENLVVSEYDYLTNSNGRVSRTLARRTARLLDTYQKNDCVEVYFVGSIVDGNALAFHDRRGIIVGRKATDLTVAHELGHCFGLKDSYVWRRVDGGAPSAGGFVYLEGYANAVESSLFVNSLCDWGEEMGRGFYEKSDRMCDVGRSILMYGVGERGLSRTDIPSGGVVSLRKRATDSSQTQVSIVGADDIEPNDERVFSR